MTKRVLHTVLVAFAMLAAQTAANAQQASAVGFLKCDVSGSVSFIFGSTRNLRCTFTPTAGPVEFYDGKIEKFGLDVGFIQGGVILWQVLAPVVANKPGSLTGTYIGATADIAVVAGVGANALVSGNKIMLNPLSVTGSQGLNIAAGIGAINLKFAGVYKR
ncbi:MAG: DUF992 domain-containing protein [Hyphomicrobiaceae bacterium]|nr:MAG: DUF992 domain-containing protein [Hyphomicrobiaceae bacterium]